MWYLMGGSSSHSFKDSALSLNPKGLPLISLIGYKQLKNYEGFVKTSNKNIWKNANCTGQSGKYIGG